MQPENKQTECLIYRNVSNKHFNKSKKKSQSPCVLTFNWIHFWLTSMWSEEVQCLAVLLQCFSHSLSLPLCVLQKLSLGILHRYFENSFLELAYVGRELECLWRSPLTALMPWGSEALVSRCQRGPSPPAEGARTNWATFGNLSKLISSWARVMISSVSSSL